MPFFQRIHVPNGLNKSIASFQNFKNAIFQRFLLILKQNRQKKSKPKILPPHHMLFEARKPLYSNEG